MEYFTTSKQSKFFGSLLVFVFFLIIAYASGNNEANHAVIAKIDDKEMIESQVLGKWMAFSSMMQGTNIKLEITDNQITVWLKPYKYGWRDPEVLNYRISPVFISIYDKKYRNFIDTDRGLPLLIGGTILSIDEKGEVCVMSNGFYDLKKGWAESWGML